MSKSTHHQSQNDFRFQTFAERIAAVSIDVVHKIQHYEEELEEQSTYFGQALLNWSDLNCTEHFKNFQQEISEKVHTLPQLVHNEVSIVEALKKHLLIPRSLAYEPLLDLVVQLARDLQADFYKYFPDFFNLLVKLLNSISHDVDILEKIFSCLAYLFKFLWRYLVKDIKEVYGLFSALLGSCYKDYIRKFAAESFAFLMRKVKDHGAFLDFLLSTLEEHPDKADGVGQLLFEMMKGVKKQFHSSAIQIFPVILSKLGPCEKSETNTKLPWQLVEQALCQMMKSSAEHTSKEHVAPMWTVLLECLSDLQKVCVKARGQKQKVKAEQVCRLLQVTSVWLDYRQGVLVCDANQVAETYSQILKTSVHPEIVGPPLLSAVSSLLVSLSDRLTMGVTAKMLGQVYLRKFAVKDLSVFTRSLYDLFLFEKDVLPNLLSYVQSQMTTGNAHTKDVLLALVTDLVLHKVSVLSDGSQLTQFKKIKLDFGVPARSAKKGNFQQYLLSLLDVNDSSLSDTVILSTLWAALVCLPHCSPVDTASLVEKIRLVWSLLVDKVMAPDLDTICQNNLLFVMEQVLLAVILLNEEAEIHSWLSPKVFLDLLRKSPSNLTVLKIVDLYLSQCSIDHKDNILTHECLLELLPLLQPNLASWSSQVRLLSIHALSLFPVKLPNLEEKAVEQICVIDICQSAERMPVTVYNYRDRLRYLQKLDHELVQPNIPIGPFEKVALYYLIGSLYINFKLMWEPVRKLIRSYAVGMDQDMFWSVMLEHLKQAANNAGESCDQSSGIKNPSDNSVSDVLTAVCEMYHCCHGHQTEGMEHPDHVNLRLQLWKTLELFPDKCEERGKDVVPIFLKFLSDEYYQRDMNSASSENISGKHSTGDQSQMHDEEDDEEEEEKDDGEVESRKKKHSKKKKKRKGLIPTLLAHLDVFSKFKKPKSLFKEQELRKIYHELLHHKDVSVQKAAFSCVLTYNHKYISPYKENFLRLLEDKTFKEELVAFSIDPDNTQIKEQHRQNLLPVLMGILYGRMQSRIGKDTTGKAKSNIRRAVVFRFLAGCSSSELKVFLDLVFEPLLHFVTDDPEAMVRKVVENIDIENVFPVRRMRGILSTALVVVKTLRHLMDDFLPSLLQILLGLAATCTACLQQRDLLKSGAVAGLKNIRQTVVLSFVEVFEEFEKYPFSDLEVKAVFEAVVWPQLDKLPQEGIYTPTPLLKLISVWTRQLRYYHLLSIPARDDKELTPLSSVFSLLNAKGCSRAVSSLILEMVDNLLSLEESEEGEAMLTAFSDSDREKFLSCKQGTKECGVSLLQPFLPSILLFLKKTVEAMGSGQLAKKQSFATELKMLAKVSGHVQSDDQCSMLCSMLFPFLDQKIKRTREMEENILNSIVNLTKVLESPRQFFRPVAKLFSVICNRQSRVFLCRIFKIIGEKCPEYKDVATVVEKLNAWNPRRTEEPDYNIRLEAFNQFNQTIRDMDAIDVEAVVPVMHNCCHFILKVDDLSLRDNSTYCLVTMVTQLAKTKFYQDVFREVVTQGILPMVKSGLFDKTETVRHEFLTVFGVLVKAFPDHPTFEGLAGLSDKEIDNDFYENIKHIQVHRRVKAMRRLIKYLEVTPVRRELLTSYFLPLTSMVTLDPAYLKIQGLREVAIDLLSVLCRLLPWQQYLRQLRFYLSLLPKKLENQKFYVRVIVAVLNSFHFDISQTELTTSNAPKVVTEKEAEMEVNKDEEDAGDGKPEEETAATLGPDTSAADDKLETSAADQQEVQLTSEGRQLCSPGLATKIHAYVLKILIPELQKLLTQKINRDEEHKSVRSKFADDHEILRVPIALAMIKLLQTLPRGMLQQKLPGILMKVCNFLKSKSREVRETSRDTLVRISQSLGLRYFNFVVKEMRDALTRGYQLHVLGFSVNRLLMNMESQLKPGDLDPALHNLSEVFKEELFGTVSEEKDVEGITKKLMEAKETKSYDSYELVAKYVGVGSVKNLISPLKQLLMTTRNKKTSQKIEEVLHRVTNGLMENTAISTETMMILVHDLIISNMEALDEKKKEKAEETDDTSGSAHQPQSCLLLTQAPLRGGEKPKSHQKTNMHVIVEFGFQLLHMCLKRSRLLQSTEQHLQLLDPLVEALSDSLYSKHVKVNSLALRCMSFLLRFPLPSLKKQITKISQGMFLLLKNYASAGAGRGENFELVVTCFKAMTVLVRDVKFYKVDQEQLQVLLSFCEEDLLDHTRQSTGFNLLKAILSRKLKIKELNDLMEKVKEMVITETAGHVRLQCRQVFLQYLLDYPHKNKVLGAHMEYYVTQLTYDLEHGRISALEMLATIFSNFPMKTLIQQSGLFFIPMAASLINDDSQKCRKLTSLAIKTLLEKIDAPTRDVLFSIVSNWIKDSKVTHRTLAYQLCGVFVEVEKNSFERRLSDILPLLRQQADPDRYVEKEEDKEFEVDHSLFSLLTAMSKIIANCHLVRNAKYTDEMNDMWDHVHHHLLYPHAWCRLTACQLFGQLFAAWPLDEVKKCLTGSHSDEYLLINTREKMKKLAQSFITQLQSELLTEDLVNQIVKNMLYVGKVIKILPAHCEAHGAKEEDEDRGEEGPSRGPTIRWLIKRMIREANYEAVNNPKVTIKRAGIFKWLAAVCMEQEKAVIEDVLRGILSALHREMTTQISADSDLKTLAQEVMELLKKLVGVETFSQVYSQIQQKRAEKRAGKKRQRATEAVSRPEVAAKRKMKKYEVRKESKKRKIQMLKTGKNSKKLKLQKMAILDD